MSVYSTPLISVSDDVSECSEESAYFTPDVSFSSATPRSSHYSSNISSGRSKSVSDISELRPARSLAFNNLDLVLGVNSRESELNSVYDKENMNCSTSSNNLLEFFPKRSRTTPLKCISNIITRNHQKFEEYAKYEKECISTPSINNTYDSTSLVYKNNLLNPKLKYRAKNVGKNKSTLLQALGIRRKSKLVYDPLNEDVDSIFSNLSSNDANCEADSMTYSRMPDPKLIRDEALMRSKTKNIWRSFHFQPKAFVSRSIRLSPIKRLFTNCRRKLSLYPLKNLFLRKSLEDKSANQVEDPRSDKNQCSCSSTALTNRELLDKIMSKLNALEDQICDVKLILKNNDFAPRTSAVNFSLPPPPPPPLPPPPPPLPNSLSSTADVLKKKVMTPESSQLIKRQLPAKTQFAITVEDIKSVKLRKTPSTLKRPSIGTPQTPGIKDGVVHNVKFKPIKRTVTQKRELSNLVSEILSPSKKTDHNERNSTLNAKLLDDQENEAVSSNFDITPVKCRSKSVKLRSAKRKDLSLDSPSRKRFNAAYKTLVFCDSSMVNN